MKIYHNITDIILNLSNGYTFKVFPCKLTNSYKIVFNFYKIYIDIKENTYDLYIIEMNNKTKDEFINCKYKLKELKEKLKNSTTTHFPYATSKSFIATFKN